MATIYTRGGHSFVVTASQDAILKGIEEATAPWPSSPWKHYERQLPLPVEGPPYASRDIVITFSDIVAVQE